MDNTSRIRDLIVRVRDSSRPDASSAARELIEIGPEAGQLLSRRPLDPWKGSVGLGLKAEVLGEVGPSRSIHYFKECLENEHPGVRRKAAEALCRLCERAAHDADLRRGLQRRARTVLPLLCRLTAMRFVGSDIPTEPYRRAISRLEWLQTFDLDRELPIPHGRPVDSVENLPVVAAARDG